MNMSRSYSPGDLRAAFAQASMHMSQPDSPFNSNVGIVLEHPTKVYSETQRQRIDNLGETRQTLLQMTTQVQPPAFRASHQNPTRAQNRDHDNSRSCPAMGMSMRSSREAQLRAVPLTTPRRVCMPAASTRQDIVSVSPEPLSARSPSLSRSPSQRFVVAAPTFNPGCHGKIAPLACIVQPRIATTTITPRPAHAVPKIITPRIATTTITPGPAGAVTSHATPRTPPTVCLPPRASSQNRHSRSPQPRSPLLYPPLHQLQSQPTQHPSQHRRPPVMQLHDTPLQLGCQPQLPGSSSQPPAPRTQQQTSQLQSPRHPVQVPICHPLTASAPSVMLQKPRVQPMRATSALPTVSIEDQAPQGHLLTASTLPVSSPVLQGPTAIEADRRLKEHVKQKDEEFDAILGEKLREQEKVLKAEFDERLNEQEKRLHLQISEELKDKQNEEHVELHVKATQLYKKYLQREKDVVRAEEACKRLECELADLQNKCNQAEHKTAELQRVAHLREQKMSDLRDESNMAQTRILRVQEQCSVAERHSVQAHEKYYISERKVGELQEKLSSAERKAVDLQERLIATEQVSAMLKEKLSVSENEIKGLHDRRSSFERTATEMQRKCTEAEERVLHASARYNEVANDLEKLSQAYEAAKQDFETERSALQENITTQLHRMNILQRQITQIPSVRPDDVLRAMERNDRSVEYESLRDCIVRKELDLKVAHSKIVELSCRAGTNEMRAHNIDLTCQRDELAKQNDKLTKHLEAQNAECANMLEKQREDFAAQLQQHRESWELRDEQMRRAYEEERAKAEETRALEQQCLVASFDKQRAEWDAAFTRAQEMIRRSTAEGIHQSVEGIQSEKPSDLLEGMVAKDDSEENAKLRDVVLRRDYDLELCHKKIRYLARQVKDLQASKEK
eukprot:TRINITY_DN2310_c0_g1_i1.p1 TRINITY_DN2310_c0_g1~~TRINITY_DN2310_c0_g1_i1.p1  ORF type:complete len:907 (-),score=127.41 TRINITY_DN2310_c0_g1_i1:143-2863(-)